MIYYDIVTRVVKLFKVLPMIIMMIFNMSTSYFSQKNISLFWRLFNDKIDLKVKVVDQYLLGGAQSSPTMTSKEMFIYV
jgi:hypothetical protein